MAWISPMWRGLCLGLPVLVPQLSSFQASLPHPSHPPTRCPHLCSRRVRVSRERADPTVQDGLALLPTPWPVRGPRPLSHSPPAPCLRSPSWECSWGLHGPRLPLTRPARQSGEPEKEPAEMLGGGLPRPRPPWGYSQHLMPKGTSAFGVRLAAPAGPLRRSYQVGGGRGFFHGSSSVPPLLPAGGATPDNHSLAPAGVMMPPSTSTERAPLLAQHSCGQISCPPLAWLLGLGLRPQLSVFVAAPRAPARHHQTGILPLPPGQFRSISQGPPAPSIFQGSKTGCSSLAWNFSLSPTLPVLSTISPSPLGPQG